MADNQFLNAFPHIKFLYIAQWTTYSLLVLTYINGYLFLQKLKNRIR